MIAAFTLPSFNLVFLKLDMHASAAGLLIPSAGVEFLDRKFIRHFTLVFGRGEIVARSLAVFCLAG